MANIYIYIWFLAIRLLSINLPLNSHWSKSFKQRKLNFFFSIVVRRNEGSCWWSFSYLQCSNPWHRQSGSSYREFQHRQRFSVTKQKCLTNKYKGINLRPSWHINTGSTHDQNEPIHVYIQSKVKEWFSFVIFTCTSFFNNLTIKYTDVNNSSLN